MYRFKIENQDDNTKIHLNYELENKWRFIVIEKDLLYFINKDSLKIQDSDFDVNVDSYLQKQYLVDDGFGE